jgi:GNAT superfamily N-acetyltransferase
MSKLKNFSLSDVEIQPVKFITKDFWELSQSVFAISYKTAKKQDGFRKIPYDNNINKYFRMAIARVNGQMVGYVSIINFDAVIDELLADNADVKNIDHPFWDKDRPQNVNRRQIETCWVNPRYQGQGIATKLYKFAIENMGATHIHIEENRVNDNLEYWQELGFKKCSLYKFMGAEMPALRLHLEYDCKDLWDLDYSSLRQMFYDRDITPAFGRSKYPANKKSFA